MELFVTERERARRGEVLTRCGLDADLDRPASHGGGPPLVLLNPGAQYGAAKCWRPEYFAELADRLIDELRRDRADQRRAEGAADRRLHQAIHAARRRSICSSKGMTLGSLKEIVRRCDLMVTNDTGPRHIAAAMDVPVVTIFGPTHPEWTEIYYARRTAGGGEGILRAVPEKGLPAGSPLHETAYAGNGL